MPNEACAQQTRRSSRRLHVPAFVCACRLLLRSKGKKRATPLIRPARIQPRFRDSAAGYDSIVMLSDRLSVSSDQIRDFCRQHRIRRLAFFGSVLREDFGPSSDVDVLVEFEPGQVPGLLRLAAIERELSVIRGGRRIDMRTPRDLSRYFRDEVLERAVVQYAEG
jgi:uncharacterized protein